MKTLKDLEKSLYLDIFKTLLVVLITIPIWLNFDFSDVAKIAESYANYNYVEYDITNNVSYALKTMSDEEAKNNNTSDVIVYNNSNTVDDYTIYLKLQDSSLLDNLKISINGNISYLKDFDYNLEDGYRHYVIIKDDIVASQKDYNINLWNNDIMNSNDDYITPEFIVA